MKTLSHCGGVGASEQARESTHPSRESKSQATRQARGSNSRLGQGFRGWECEVGLGCAQHDIFHTSLLALNHTLLVNLHQHNSTQMTLTQPASIDVWHREGSLLASSSPSSPPPLLLVLRTYPLRSGIASRFAYCKKSPNTPILLHHPSSFTVLPPVTTAICAATSNSRTSISRTSNSKFEDIKFEQGRYYAFEHLIQHSTHTKCHSTNCFRPPSRAGTTAFL